MENRPSPAIRCTTWFLNIMGSYLKAKRFPAWCRRMERRSYPAPAPIPVSLRRRCQVSVSDIEGQPVYTLTPMKGRRAMHIIYTHGGCYVLPLQSIHWGIIQQLIEHTGASVTVPIYPLAPEFDHKPAFTLLNQVYQERLQSHAEDRIILCGDSAGGGLALAQAMIYRDCDYRLPDRIILFSPWLDVSMSNPDAALLESIDPLLGITSLAHCGKWWAGGVDIHEPHISPLFGDMAGLPPIDVFTGTYEIFFPDIHILQQKVVDAGGMVNVYEYAGAFHDFVGIPFLPESQTVFKIVANVLKSHDFASS